MGDELGDGLHPGGGRRGVTLLERDGIGVRPEYLHAEKVARAGQSIALGDTLLKWYEIAPPGAAIEPAVSDLARLAPRRRGASRRAPARRHARVRDPPPLRRGLLLPPPLHVAERERAVGDGLGEGRRRATRTSTPGRSTARTGRRSASGSSARSRTSGRRGAGSCAPPRDRDARLDYLRDTFEGLV